MYVDMVQLLERRSNFDPASGDEHNTDYLRALARCLEAGYFGLAKVDADVLTLMRGLARVLQPVHRFPKSPDTPDPAEVASSGGSPDFRGLSAEGGGSGGGSGAETQDSVGEGQGRYVKLTPEGSEVKYGARVDEEGRLNIAWNEGAEVAGDRSETKVQVDSAEVNSLQRKISVKFTGEDMDTITVKITDNQGDVTQTRSFSVSNDEDFDGRVGGEEGSQGWAGAVTDHSGGRDAEGFRDPDSFHPSHSANQPRDHSGQSSHSSNDPGQSESASSSQPQDQSQGFGDSQKNRNEQENGQRANDEL